MAAVIGGLFAASCGVLLAGGLIAVIVGWRAPAAPVSRSYHRRLTDLSSKIGPRRLALAAAWLTVGLMAASITRWPLLVVVVPGLGIGLPLLLGKPSNRELELLQALDRWVRTMAAILPTGRSIGDAIRVSVRQAPTLLVEPLSLLVDRLDDRWTLTQALYAMADDLDSADADAVLASLALAAQRGGTGAQATLSSLADAIQERLKALREIEAERAKPRIVVRQVTTITLTVLGGALLFGGTFFEPYRSGIGQVILAVLITAYLGSLVFLRRLTVARPRQRILRRAT